jgi:hypothetical protein
MLHRCRLDLKLWRGLIVGRLDLQHRVSDTIALSSRPVSGLR